MQNNPNFIIKKKKKKKSFLFPNDNNCPGNLVLEKNYSHYWYLYLYLLFLWKQTKQILLGVIKESTKTKQVKFS